MSVKQASNYNNQQLGNSSPPLHALSTICNGYKYRDGDDVGSLQALFHLFTLFKCFCYGQGIKQRTDRHAIPYKRFETNQPSNQQTNNHNKSIINNNDDYNCCNYYCCYCYCYCCCYSLLFTAVVIAMFHSVSSFAISTCHYYSPVQQYQEAYSN